MLQALHSRFGCERNCSFALGTATFVAAPNLHEKYFKGRGGGSHPLLADMVRNEGRREKYILENMGLF